MYSCDTNGIVYAKNGEPLKPSINYCGYEIVNFYNNHVRKGFGVHTIIATTFIPHEDYKNQVNHKNGIKTDNRLDNLEWGNVSKIIMEVFENTDIEVLVCKQE